MKKAKVKKPVAKQSADKTKKVIKKPTPTKKMLTDHA